MTRPFGSLPRPQQAALLCQTPQFASFLASRYDYPSEHDPAVFVRHYCAVLSRAELATNAFAGRLFDMLHNEYDAWRGRIGGPDELEQPR